MRRAQAQQDTPSIRVRQEPSARRDQRRAQRTQINSSVTFKLSYIPYVKFESRHGTLSSASSLIQGINLAKPRAQELLRCTSDVVNLAYSYNYRVQLSTSDEEG